MQIYNSYYSAFFLVLILVAYKQLSNREFFARMFEPQNVEQEHRSLTSDEINEIEETTIFLACFLINKQFNKTLEHSLAAGYIYTHSHDSKDLFIIQKINIFFLQRCLRDLKFSETPEVIII